MIADLIREIAQKEIRVVSIDIFDTLLFRACIQPSDIFGKMFEKRPELFSPHLYKEDWVALRREAEQRARRKMFECEEHYEVTLEDIYSRLPEKPFPVVELRNLEIQCEKEYCFVNQEIYCLIKALKENTGCRLILCSDMYLSSQQLADILQSNGVDLSYIEKIFVSSEYKQSKKFSGLYEKVLSEYGIRPGEMLHIGDNHYSDVGVPRYLGIYTWHYHVISEASYRYPFLHLETQLEEGLCDELRPLRLMASTCYSKRKELSDKERFWFDQGAMIYGPFLTCAVEWILDQAEQNGVNCIRPLMREGELITKLLKRAAAYRDRKYDIQPLYISRFAIFTALFEKITSREIRYLVNTYNIHLSVVFRILKIEDRMGEYRVYADCAMNELRRRVHHGVSVYWEIIEYLETPEMIELIRERNRGSAQLVFDYLHKMQVTSKGITVDVGWRGSIQNSINRLLLEKGWEPELLHLLLVCNPVAVENAIEGCEIRGFMGNYGACAKIYGQLSPRIMEMAFLSEEGTVIGYERSQGELRPVTKEIDYPEWQIAAMRSLQEGILNFQKVYHSMAECKPYFVNWVNRSEELCKVIGRLHSYPTREEAEKIKNLEYDQNFGENTFHRIIEEDLLKKCEKTGMTDYYGTARNTGIMWYSGLNVLALDRMLYCKQMALMNRRYNNMSMICLTERIIKEQSDSVVLVTAGKMTKMVLLYMILAGQFSSIVGIIDNDVMAQGTKMNGVEIFPVDHRFPNALYVFTTIRREFYEELYQQLRGIVGESMHYIGYFDER